MNPLPKPKTLLVDETRRTLRLAQTFLSQDCDVVACDSVHEAMEQLESVGFHVMVASAHLTSVNVFELVSMARELQPHLHCVVISDVAMPNEVLQTYPHVRGITAPYHPAALIAQVERLVAEGEAAADALYPSRAEG